MIERDLILVINKQTNTDFSEDITMKELHENLTVFINDLIQNNFERLIAILYKIDIDENKLKKVLKNNTEKYTPDIIAGLIIAREIQKLETRKNFK